MIVYSRRSGAPEVRAGWVVVIRVVTVCVTLGMSWPWREAVPTFGYALLGYAAVSVFAVALALLDRRRKYNLLGTAVGSVQIAAELGVISGLVYLSGGLASPAISLYVMSIVGAALTHRLIGTLVIAGLASASFLTAVWVGIGQKVATLWSPSGLVALSELSDEEFFAVFLRLCIFFLCAFAGGYLAERLGSKGEALAHTSEALKNAKLETGDILKHLHSGVLTIDASGCVVYFNRAAEEILGIPERAVRGRMLAEILGEQFPLLVERLESVLRSSKMDIRTELHLKRVDGRSVPLGLSTSVLRGSNGSPRGVIAVFQDLTEAKELEERARSRDRLAAIGELSAGIAHEIRNPLAAISGSVEVLSRDLQLEGESARLMKLILRESSRLNAILSDFLLYARDIPSVGGTSRLRMVVAEAVEVGRHHAESVAKGRISLRSALGPEDRTAAIDPDHLKQVLINLVINAIDACEGTLSGEVVIAAGTPDLADLVLLPDELSSDPEGLVTLTVSDNGSGVPDDIRDRLFEPFVSSKAKGTGLGLAIARRIIDNAGGHLGFTDRPDGGTEFTIHLRRGSSAGPQATPRDLFKGDAVKTAS